MPGIKKIMLIDDEQIAVKIGRHLIKRSLPDMDVCTFTCPEKGVEYIREEFVKNPIETVLLLDINMPALTGWEVLEKLAGMEEIIKKHLHIYMFSSSVSYQDRALSSQHPLVTDFIEKPMTEQKLLDIIKQGNYFIQQHHT